MKLAIFKLTNTVTYFHQIIPTDTYWVNASFCFSMSKVKYLGHQVKKNRSDFEMTVTSLIFEIERRLKAQNVEKGMLLAI